MSESIKGALSTGLLMDKTSFQIRNKVFRIHMVRIKYVSHQMVSTNRTEQEDYSFIEYHIPDSE